MPAAADLRLSTTTILNDGWLVFPMRCILIVNMVFLCFDNGMNYILFFSFNATGVVFVIATSWRPTRSWLSTLRLLAWNNRRPWRSSHSQDKPQPQMFGMVRAAFFQYFLYEGVILRISCDFSWKKRFGVFIKLCSIFAPAGPANCPR